MLKYAPPVARKQVLKISSKETDASQVVQRTCPLMVLWASELPCEVSLACWMIRLTAPVIIRPEPRDRQPPALRAGRLGQPALQPKCHVITDEQKTWMRLARRSPRPLDLFSRTLSY